MAFNRLEVNDLATATLDDSDQVIVGESNTYKKATVSALKNNILGSAPSYTTDTEPYLMRRTAHVGVVGKCALNKLVGGSLGWNQLAKELNSTNWINESGVTSSFSDGVATFSSTTSRNGIRSNANTIISGHKYIQSCEFKSATSIQVLFNVSAFTEKPSMTLSGDSAWHTLANICTASTTTTTAQFFIFGGGTYSNLQAQKPQIIDLTAMFGSTIADYIYDLEQATAGAGVAWLSKYIDLSTYHAYDAGSIQSVQTTAHVTTGFNQFDEQWEVGNISTETGLPVTNATTIRSKNYIRVKPNTDYYCGKIGTGGIRALFFYDANQNFIISYIDEYYPNKIFNTANACYVKFRTYEAYGTSYKNDICINISKTTGTPKNGDYVPYDGHTYPLGSDTLRGIPQLVNNELQYDGDIKTADGTITRKYGTVDLGTLTWNYNSTTQIFYATLPQTTTSGSPSLLPNIVCAKYITVSANTLANNASTDKACTTGYIHTANGINIKDSAFTTAAAFKTAMSGVYLVYELATETTESSTAYQHIQTIDADGTESFTTSSPVPVGHETQTPDNILAALSWVGE